MVRKSKIRHDLSLDTEANNLAVPFGWNLVLLTVCLNPCNVETQLASRGSHNLTKLSFEPLTIKPKLDANQHFSLPNDVHSKFFPLYHY